MGNAVSCFDPIREHPPYSWPKDHPGREAAIRERKLARRNQKIHGAHPASNPARETPNAFQKPAETPPAATPAPSAGAQDQQPAPSPESKPLLDPEAAADKAAADKAAAEPTAESATDPPAPESADPAESPALVPVADVNPEGDDSITVEQAPPAIEPINNDDAPAPTDQLTDPVAPVDVPPTDDAVEELAPAAEVLSESPRALDDEPTPEAAAEPLADSMDADAALDMSSLGAVSVDDTSDATDGDGPKSAQLNDLAQAAADLAELEEKPISKAVPDSVDEQQYADAEEVEIPAAEAATEDVASSIDTRRAMFDKADDSLPEAKEVKRDVLDPVTNEFISLAEYRSRQLDRAQGVVRERVEKFEEIDDELSRQKAKLAAIEAARNDAKEKTWTFKSDKSIPKSPVSKRDPASYILDNEKFIDTTEQQAADGKIDPMITDEVLPANMRSEIDDELNLNDGIEEKSIPPMSMPDGKMDNEESSGLEPSKIISEQVAGP